MKTIGLSLIAVVCLSLFSPFAAGYTGGTGTVEDPFKIASVEDFLAMTTAPGDWGSCFILTKDINLSGQTFANSPIAFGTRKRVDGNFKGTRFSGTFDGDDHHISHLTIQNNTGNDNIALFGNTRYATIKDLHLVDVNINISNIYSWYVGALVGEMYEGTVSNCSSSGTITACNGSLSIAGLVGSQNWGTISQCSSSVSITAGNDCGTVGGLVGGCSAGTIQLCFSTGAITGGSTNRNMAGLVGYHNSSFAEYAISDCYSTGNISAGANSYNIAGLIGMNSQGPVNRCYSTGLVTAGSGSTAIAGCLGYVGGGSNFKSLFWDTNTSQQTLGVGSGSSTNVYGRSTAEMMTMSTFTNAPGWQSGWDFSDGDGNPAVWKMTSEGSSYPVLAWQPSLQRYSGGAGTAAKPWQIATKDDLLLLSSTPADWDKAFIVTANIDLAGTVFDKAPIAPDTDGSDWEFQGTAFTGSFDGGGYSISKLTISNTTGGDYLGLFGCTQDASIRNLSLKGIGIDALGDPSVRIGGLIGRQIRGITELCSVSGVIHAGAYDPLFEGSTAFTVGGLIGGILGEIWESLAVIRCSSSVEVQGTYSVGGLVGYQSNCTLRECFSTGSAEGYQCTGGLVGQGTGIIERCFTTAGVGDLDGGLYMGGMAGYYGGNISDSYAHNSIFMNSGSSYVGGFAGSASGIDRCYSASTITLRDFVVDYIGAFIGFPQGSVSACFFDSDIAGWAGEPSEASALTTAQMQTADQFINVGWDFADESIDGTPAVWRIREGRDYPRLAWQLILPGDIAGDPQVNLTDLMVVTEQWMQEDCNGCPADVNGDGSVNMEDISIVGGYWLMMPGMGAAMQP